MASRTAIGENTFFATIGPMPVVMPSPLDSVSEGIMFSGYPSAAFVRSFVFSSGQILLPR